MVKDKCIKIILICLRKPFEDKTEYMFKKISGCEINSI